MENATGVGAMFSKYIPTPGSIGTLSVKVLKMRASTHIGDLFHGVFPEYAKGRARLKI